MYVFVFLFEMLNFKLIVCKKKIKIFYNCVKFYYRKFMLCCEFIVVVIFGGGVIGYFEMV